MIGFGKSLWELKLDYNTKFLSGGIFDIRFRSALRDLWTCHGRFRIETPLARRCSRIFDSDFIVLSVRTIQELPRSKVFYVIDFRPQVFKLEPEVGTWTWGILQRLQSASNTGLDSRELVRIVSGPSSRLWTGFQSQCSRVPGPMTSRVDLIKVELITIHPYIILLSERWPSPPLGVIFL